MDKSDIVENSSPDAAQNVVNAAKEKDIPVIFFNRDFDASVINSGGPRAVGVHQVLGSRAVAAVVGQLRLAGAGQLGVGVLRSRRGRPHAG